VSYRCRGGGAVPMAYQSLYRKYRPQTFADVVGQGHVVRTLQNALQSGRIAHGFLFTGTRGTAKTTVARLLAKCLNCESQSAAVAEPCNDCDACRAIASGTCIDVVEMDAASHRGVADIEEVRKAVGYGPMQFRTKVFIIDEAHQLSSDAKDAFLKTLEEPPPGVVFILATTEPQSIPITIRSRCQQFDFKRGSLAEIAGRLRTVAEAEGVEIGADAVHRIARAAEGSYRDALSLLEQVLAFCDRSVSSADVDTVLGALGADHLARLTTAMASADTAAALELAAEFTDSGKEVRTVLRALTAHLRDLLLLRSGADPSAVGIPPDNRAELQRAGEMFSAEQLLGALDLVNTALADLRWNNQHRLLLEITFVKLAGCTQRPAVSVGAPAQASSSAPRPVPPQPARPQPPPTSVPPVSAAERPASPDPSAAPPRTTVETTIAAVVDLPAPESTELPTSEQPEEQTGPGLFDDMDASTVTPAPPSPDSTSSDPLLIDPGPALAARFGLDDVLRVWPSFLEEAGKYSKQAQVFLTAARPSSVDAGTVVITFSNRANCEMMQQQKQLEFIRRMLGRALGSPSGSVPVRLHVDASTPVAPKQSRASKPRHDALAALDAMEAQDAADGSGRTQVQSEPAAPSPPPATMVPAAPAPPPPAATTENVADNPLVQDILSTFGGTIIDS
jgi:DNA polymerase-3 subunit gamma/tau